MKSSESEPGLSVSKMAATVYERDNCSESSYA